MSDARVPDSAAKKKDPGWEIGLRSTVAAPLEDVWDFLLEDGLVLWLGEATLLLEKGAEYETADDIRGRILGYTPGSRIRLTWQPGEWNHDSTLQLSVREAPDGTTIAIHQERLADRDERKIMLGHWKEVLAEVEKALSPSAS